MNDSKEDKQEAREDGNLEQQGQNNAEAQPEQSQGNGQQNQQQGAINDEQLKEMAIEVLKSVYDPEIPVDIYELGLIYEVSVYPVNNLYVQMTLTSPACPVAGSLPAEVETKLGGIKGVNNVDLELTFDPPWDMSKMSEEARLELGLM